MMTMFLPSFSGRDATSMAAATAAPDEMPTGIPSTAREHPRRVESGLVADGHDLVDDGAIENGRHEAGADALDLVRTGRAAGQDGLSSGSTATIFNVGARLQHLADAGDGAARADAGDEDIDRAVRVVPDFLGRGAARGSPGWPDFRTAAG